jgi:hypothetical protein
LLDSRKISLSSATHRWMRCCLWQEEIMRRRRVALYALALVGAAGLALACGSSSEHVLQSVTLSPTTADAQDYPGGQVQFTATGFYNTDPKMVTPLSAGWGSCYNNGPTNAISVSNGVAQCASGAVGTFTVWANDPQVTGSMCDAVTACGGGCFIAGTAQLTCP